MKSLILKDGGYSIGSKGSRCYPTLYGAQAVALASHAGFIYDESDK
jgi:hypothetical protein